MIHNIIVGASLVDYSRLSFIVDFEYVMVVLNELVTSKTLQMALSPMDTWLWPVSTYSGTGPHRFTSVLACVASSWLWPK